MSILINPFLVSSQENLKLIKTILVAHRKEHTCVSPLCFMFIPVWMMGCALNLAPFPFTIKFPLSGWLILTLPLISRCNYQPWLSLRQFSNTSFVNPFVK